MTIWRQLIPTKIAGSSLLTACRLSTSSLKSKWTKETAEALQRWNSENLNVYGPVIGGNKNKSSDKNDSALQKRGRPKGSKNKIKTTAGTSGHGQAANQTDHTIKPLTRTDSTADVATNASILYSEPDVKNDLPSLTGILSFPLFPPSRTEYYVNPPELPSIHIPGHTERSSFQKPFYPSVGTILGATQSVQSRMALKRWRENLVLEIGEDGFKKHQQQLFSRGSDFHSCLQKFLEGTPGSEISISTENEGYWNSVQPMLKDVTDVLSVEQMLVHRDLCYRGQYDCLANFRGQLSVIDWKTSKKAKSDIRFTYDNPLQVSAYVGAHNFTKNVDSMIDKALIVVCYEDGQPADIHVLSRRMCVEYWTRWLQRLHQYWTEKLQT